MSFFKDRKIPVIFPDQGNPDGIIAVGGKLSPDYLLSAYWQGVFPWFSEDEPILWWSPDPRFVLFPEKLHVSRRLSRKIRGNEYRLTINRAFPEVIRSCAEVYRPGQPGTWISEGMMEGYIRLHALGHAHSFEAWQGEELVGGLYGVLVGGVFCGESMFARRSDASKVAFVSALKMLFSAGVKLIDSQVYTDHLASFGAEEIPRARYLELLHRYRSLQIELPGGS